MKSEARRSRARARRASASAGGITTSTCPPPWLGSAGRGWSAGSSNRSGAPAMCRAHQSTSPVLGAVLVGLDSEKGKPLYAAAQSWSRTSTLPPSNTAWWTTNATRWQSSGVDHTAARHNGAQVRSNGAAASALAASTAAAASAAV